MTSNNMRDKMIFKLQSFNFNLVNFDDREASTLLNDAQDEIVNERFLALSNVKRKGFEADTKRRLDLSGLITSHTEFVRDYKDGGATPGDFMIGTPNNGALKTPDMDYQYTPDSDLDEYGVFVRIPDEVLYPISESCDTSRAGKNKSNVPVEVVSYEEYRENIYNSFKSPYYNKVWRLDWGTYTTAGTTDEVSSKYNGNSLTGFTGENADGNGGDITINTHRSALLIPGKDWTVEKYRLHYVKRPQRIVVDTITPGNQEHCELHPSVHDEVVDKAVQLAIEARIPAQGKYQVAEKENIENQ